MALVLVQYAQFAHVANLAVPVQYAHVASNLAASTRLLLYCCIRIMVHQHLQYNFHE